MFFPKLTAYQTLENSQGTLDPLGLYSIADRLANYLAPGLRERMKHPRYLTAIAVGAVVCGEFGEDELAADEVSQPWQVYEWYVASALVKRYEDDIFQLRGLSGREKTMNAKKAGVPLSAIRYLKLPSVFGFHGVYRTLAKEINLISDNRIGEFGLQLIDTWEQEQGLTGFRVGIKNTKGNEFRIKIFDAVKQGLAEGAVARKWNWDFYNVLAENLAPKSPGKKETLLLFERLSDLNTRKELINFLISQDGQAAIKSESEKDFHTRFLSKAIETRSIILAIQAYEKVSRLLFNAFYESLQWMEKNQSKGSIAKLALLTHVAKAYKDLPTAFKKADEKLGPFRKEAVDFLTRFQELRDSSSITDWLKLLFEHHASVQGNKPPNGKAPWILQHSSGNYLLNSNQSIQQNLNDEYVHQYRTFALQSFMKDLGEIKE